MCRRRSRSDPRLSWNRRQEHAAVVELVQIPTMASSSAPPFVSVVGLGYVGLPLAVATSAAGLRVLGYDVSSRVVDGLQQGRSHVDDISDAEVRDALVRGFRATTDVGDLKSADVVVVCVPTPLDENRAPDLSLVEAAMASIRDVLRAGMLVVLESTTYPGTTDGLARRILEESGLTAGVDFHLAFSPERIDPGNEVWGVKNTPKIVGGLTPACTERAVAFYSWFIDEVVPASGPREAEMAKLLENTYRHVNIALVNELAVLSHELDVDLWEAIRLASTKPFGFNAFYPGPGVGGHCIPIDPNYLSHQLRVMGFQFRFVELAQEISGQMPAYVVRRIQNLLNAHAKPVRGSRVLLLGLTYKKNIADDRETPARDVVRHLRLLGANVVACDPHLASFEVDKVAVEIVPPSPIELGKADVVVLLQAHSAFDLEEIVSRSQSVFDTRGVLNGPNVERL